MEVAFPQQRSRRGAVCWCLAGRRSHTPAWLLLSSAHIATRLSPTPHPWRPAGWGGRGAGRRHSQNGCPRLTTEMFHTVWRHAPQSERRERGRGGDSLLRCLSSRPAAVCTEAPLPRQGLDSTCWWEVDNKYFCFPLLLHSLCFIKLPLSHPTSYFSSYFLPPGPAEEGSDRAAGWAPDIQPESTHHSRRKIVKNLYISDCLAVENATSLLKSKYNSIYLETVNYFKYKIYKHL